MANKNNDNKATDKLIADPTTNSEDFTRNMASKLEEAESKFKEIPLPGGDDEQLSSGAKESLAKNTSFISETDSIVDNISAQNSKNKGFNAEIDAIINGDSTESSTDVVSGEKRGLSGVVEALADDVGGTHQATIDAIISRGSAESRTDVISDKNTGLSGAATGLAGNVGDTHQEAIDAIINGATVGSEADVASGESKGLSDIAEDLAGHVDDSVVETLNQNDSSQVVDVASESPESISELVADSVEAMINSDTQTAVDDMPQSIIKELDTINHTLGQGDKEPLKGVTEAAQLASLTSAIDLSSKKEEVDAEITKIEKESNPENSLGLASEIKTQPTEGGVTGSLGQQVGNTVQEHISDYPDKGDHSDDPILGSYEDKYLDLPAGSVTEKPGFPWVLLIGVLAIIWAAVWRFNLFESEKLDVAGGEFNVAESVVDGVGNTGLASLNKNTDEISIPSNAIEVETKIEKQSKGMSSTSKVISEDIHAVTTDILANTSGEAGNQSLVTDAIEKVGVEPLSVASGDLNNVTQGTATDNSVAAISAFLKSDDKSQSKGFILYGLNFNTASSRISSDSAKVVADLATVMQMYPSLKIRLEGHTDNQGNPEKNKLLSSYRAKAVKVRLVSLNVRSERILVEGLGQEFPITDNGTRAGRMKNRRVEVILLTGNQKTY